MEGRVASVIARSYSTKEECVAFFVDDMFDRVDSTWFEDDGVGYGVLPERFSFYGSRELSDAGFCRDEEEDSLVYTGRPMWNTWFAPRERWLHEKIGKMPLEVARCGFTLVYLHDEFIALGVDGAGYSFVDTHFAELYDLLGMHWHDE